MGWRRVGGRWRVWEAERGWRAMARAWDLIMEESQGGVADAGGLTPADIIDGGGRCLARRSGGRRALGKAKQTCFLFPTVPFSPACPQHGSPSVRPPPPPAARGRRRTQRRGSVRASAPSPSRQLFIRALQLDIAGFSYHNRLFRSPRPFCNMDPPLQAPLPPSSRI